MWYSTPSERCASLWINQACRRMLLWMPTYHDIRVTSLCTSILSIQCYWLLALDNRCIMYINYVLWCRRHAPTVSLVLERRVRLASSQSVMCTMPFDYTASRHSGRRRYARRVLRSSAPVKRSQLSMSYARHDWNLIQLKNILRYVTGMWHAYLKARI